MNKLINAPSTTFSTAINKLQFHNKTQRINLLLNNNIERITQETEQMRIIKKSIGKQIQSVKKSWQLGMAKVLKDKVNEKKKEKSKKRSREQSMQKSVRSHTKSRHKQNEEIFQSLHLIRPFQPQKQAPKHQNLENIQSNSLISSMNNKNTLNEQTYEQKEVNSQQSQAKNAKNQRMVKTYSSAKFHSISKLQNSGETNNKSPKLMINGVKRMMSHKQFVKNDSQAQDHPKSSQEARFNNPENNQKNRTQQKIQEKRFKQKLLHSKHLINIHKSRHLSSQTEFKLSKNIQKTLILSKKHEQLSELFHKKLIHQIQKNEKFKQKRIQSRFLHQNNLIKINILKEQKIKQKKAQENLIKLKISESRQDMLYKQFLKQKQQLEIKQRLMYKLQFLKGMGKKNQKTNKI